MKRKFDVHEFLVHFVVGALGGALLGLALWARFDRYAWSKDVAIACILAGGVFGG